MSEEAIINTEVVNQVHPDADANVTAERMDRFQGILERAKGIQTAPAPEVKGPEPVKLEQKPDPAPEDPKPEHGNRANKEESNKALRQKLEAETKAREEAEQRAQTVQERIAELEKKSEEWSLTAKERDELKSKYEEESRVRSEKEQQLAFYDITKLTAYQNEVQKPLESRWAGVDEIISAHKLDAQTFERALGEPDRAKRSQMLEDLTVDIPGIDKAELMEHYRGIRELWAKGSAMQKNAQETYHAMQEQEKKQREESTAKSREVQQRAFDAVAEELIRKEHDPEVVKSVLKEVKGMDFDSQPPDVKAMMALSMHVLVNEKPKMQEQIKALKAEKAELEASLKRYTDRPGAANSGIVTRAASSKVEYEAPEAREARLAGMFGVRRV
jgi:hypothetical protein